jgi:tetratricopeptide (TPR) repeat protein
MKTASPNRFTVAFLLCTALAHPALASETPRYEPTPAWVLPAPVPSVAGEGAPIFQTMDQQDRIADGGVTSYHELAARAISAEALARIGTITLSWQPFHGDLVIHRVDILRDGQRIDVLKAGQKFTVIRREQRLEQLELDGLLTATLQVEGLRVGDVLDYAFSITSKDPVLKGQVQTAAFAMSEPFKVGFARARFLWPTGTPIKWKAHPIGIVSSESDKGGWHDLTFKLPAPKQPELPNDAPLRFHRLPGVEATSFASWAEVSRTNAPLYETKGLIAPGSPLAQEVARIRDASPDPKRRAAAALALVQDRIRYFLNGMNGGNYQPQAPDKTWAVGYGDCKAKTLLLLALLDGLGIDAEPVLANIGEGDHVPDRLPSFGAFNHIFVHARIDGADYWMDGTGRGSRLEDLQDPPPFGWLLPARRAGAELLKLPNRAPVRPTHTVALTIDQSAGIGIPAPFQATVTIRGAAADSLRAASAQLDKEHLLGLALASLGGAAGPQAFASTEKFSFDQAAATATIDVSGVTVSSMWQRGDHRYRYRPATSFGGVNLGADRARTAWKDIPVATGAPSHTLTTITILLPDGGRQITIEGDQTANTELAGHTLARKATLADGIVTIQEEATASGAELPASDLPAARAKAVAARNRLVRLTTTTDYPAAYVQVSESKRAHRLDKIGAAFTTWIADKPDDVNRTLARATFYESTFQWREAQADLDRAVSIDASLPNLQRRAALSAHLGDKAKAAEDYKAMLALDPSSKRAMAQLGVLQADTGQKPAALDGINAQIDAAGEDKPEWLSAKAQILAEAGDATGAIAALDEAATTKPGNPGFLNERCWVKGTLNTQLDTALQDCTRAIELSSNNAAALDSRSLVYFRQKRFPEALADANAALDLMPSLANALFLRAVIERASGDRAHGDVDLANAKLIAPRIAEDYARWKIVP